MTKIIEKIPVSNTEQIYICVEDYRDKRKVHIRRYWLNGDDWCPTRKGVALDPPMVKQCIRGLKEAMAQISDSSERIGGVDDDLFD